VSDETGATPLPDDPARPPGQEDRPHEETGLDLARSIARSMAGRGPTARKRAASRRRRTEPRATGAHPDDRDPQTLDQTLGRLISEQGWNRDLRMHAVFSRWELIVGREVAQHATPVSFVPADVSDDGGGHVVVHTDSTAWATQMRLLAATVVRRLNEELGDGTVARIEVRGPVAPSWKKGRRSVRDGRGPRDTYG
jgi:predicted nucleic acid-binding Zn ribbon protein